MRICDCGGIVGQHDLTKGREAWSCRSCGRYEIFNKTLPTEGVIAKVPLLEEQPNGEHHE